MRGNSGKMYIVTEGVNAGRTITAYHKDQHPDFMKMGKVCFWIEVDAPQSALFDSQKKIPAKRMISIDKLKLVGYVE